MLCELVTLSEEGDSALQTDSSVGGGMIVTNILTY